MRDDPRNMLEPNYIGDAFTNQGLGALSKNHGVGVKEALPKDSDSLEERSPSGRMRNKLRVSKARQFGRTKETVGF